MSWKNLVIQLWFKMPSANQIVEFFDHEYLWKESIDILDFLIDVIIKTGSIRGYHVGCSQLCLLSNQFSGFFDYQYL